MCRGYCTFYLCSSSCACLAAWLRVLLLRYSLMLTRADQGTQSQQRTAQAHGQAAHQTPVNSDSGHMFSHWMESALQLHGHLCEIHSDLVGSPSVTLQALQCKPHNHPGTFFCYHCLPASAAAALGALLQRPEQPVAPAVSPAATSQHYWPAKQPLQLCVTPPVAMLAAVHV